MTSGPGSPFTLCIFSIGRDTCVTVPTSSKGINHQRRVMRMGAGRVGAQGRRECLTLLWKETKEVTRKLPLLVQRERVHTHSKEQRWWQCPSRRDAAHRAFTGLQPAPAPPGKPLVPARDTLSSALLSHIGAFPSWVYMPDKLAKSRGEK